MGKLLVFTALGVSLAACEPADRDTFDTAKIGGEGTLVSLQYTIRLHDGTEVASNIGTDPLEFTVGRGEVFPALEAALKGLTIGDERNVQLTADEAYGPRDEEAVREVALDLVPEESRELGTVLMAEDQEGETREVTVIEIGAESVLLDLNHPLAGEALSIDVRILSVVPPGSKE